ncbi:MAG TPA: CHASE3 domain-containing protein, partial [Terrimicrobiaceae bacterium]|nr:CHASE3 domain-containing protein [Terrimicrobiaceae bacterium]
MRRVRLFFVLMATLLVSSIAAGYLAGRVALDAAAKVKSFDSVIQAMQNLRSTIQDAETGQRGYLLTRDASYLKPYEEAVATVQRKVDVVRKMADSGLVPSEQVDRLESLTGRKIEELRTTVDLLHSGRNSAAMGIVRSDQGKALMDSIRETMSEIVSTEESQRAAASQAADSALQLRSFVFLAAVLVNLAFLAWAYRRIHKEMRQHLVASLEIRRQKEILSVTLASIGDAVIITDIRGRITFMNEVAEKLTGWSAKEAEDRPCAEVFHIINEETGSPVESPVDKVLTSGAIAGLAN